MAEPQRKALDFSSAVIYYVALIDEADQSVSRRTFAVKRVKTAPVPGPKSSKSHQLQIDDQARK
ncbi:hypothetical protein GJ744_001585 [Endocarpon pusillum]|uniref:Uncharacterized protein n=1 Tax=Endocarpon pusillum TaxID=364733 RepID=A0A8H7AA07_9EURO|nr:hypothetical protein GJ744_001585 [Endocarpon pusillum]